ncbi:hypothetical protein [Streptomyces sp. NPDC057302]|uniref:hypothetical protein n=1 Tax=Streptomyces sp. NPDC057302 TaxID=3346094 RepID=UPI003631841F
MSLALVPSDPAPEHPIRVCPLRGCPIFIQNGAAGLQAHLTVVHPPSAPPEQLALFEPEDTP